MDTQTLIDRLLADEPEYHSIAIDLTADNKASIVHLTKEADDVLKGRLVSLAPIIENFDPIPVYEEAYAKGNEAVKAITLSSLRRLPHSGFSDGRVRKILADGLNQGNRSVFKFAIKTVVAHKLTDLVSQLQKRATLEKDDYNMELIKKALETM